MKHAECPLCGTTSVKNIDKGAKRYYRLLIGESRLCCLECKITWKRNRPNSFHRIARNIKALRYYKHKDNYAVLVTPVLLDSKYESFSNFVATLLEKKQDITIMLDLSQLDTLDFAFFIFVVRAYNECRKKGIKLNIFNASEEMKNNIRLTSMGFLVKDY